MEQVFAPWRIDWIERSDKNADVDGCVFCAFADDEADAENKVVARSDHAFVLLNNYPYTPGHAMVIPAQHTGEYGDLRDEELLDHARLKQRTLDALDDAMRPNGFNTGCNLGGDAAGGSIDDHLHTHVVPRWQEDTNFMPVTTDTKVIVQALDETYEELRGGFASLETTDDGDGAVRVNP